MSAGSESVCLGASRAISERVRSATRSQIWSKYRSESCQLGAKCLEILRSPLWHPLCKKKWNDNFHQIRSNIVGLWVIGSIFQDPDRGIRGWSRTRSGEYLGGWIERFPNSSIDIPSVHVVQGSCEASIAFAHRFRISYPSSNALFLNRFSKQQLENLRIIVDCFLGDGLLIEKQQIWSKFRSDWCHTFEHLLL